MITCNFDPVWQAQQICGMLLTDIPTQQSMPKSNLGPQVSKTSAAITPPALNNQFAVALTQANLSKTQRV